MSEPPMGRAHLPTEGVDPAWGSLSEASTEAAFDLFDRADRALPGVVSAAKRDIVAAIELVTERLARGGRLLYVGAGTSGRLGVLDAVECPPTFQSDPSQVQGRLAGGPGALLTAVEGAEDSRQGGAEAVADAGPADVVFGIAAGGTTPFVHGALAAARAQGAATVFLACVPRALAPDEADVSIRLDTGPEVLAGSTRLKAATATKMVLNRVTTVAMAKLGKVHGNLMVDVSSGSCAKLRERARGIVERLTGLAPDAADELLARAGGNAKVATVMHARAVDAEAANELLVRAHGILARALEPDGL